jgi:hypothetical protein
VNTAYLSSSKIACLDHFISAQWLDSPNATLRVSFAAPGFAKLATSDVVEPYASRLWNLIQPAEDVADEPPADARTWGRNVGTAMHAPAPEPARNGNGHHVKTTNRYGPPTGSPAAERYSAPPARPRAQTNYDGPPQNGKQLHAWGKRITERGECDLLGFLKDWGRTAGLPSVFGEWPPRAVVDGHQAALAFLQDEGIEP